jgi:Tfp pilus assembly protein FimT
MATTVQRNFSLIEVIAITIVMAILLTFAAPAVNQALRGTGVNIAAKEIGSQVYLARQYALANRRYCAVLMPGANAQKAGIRTEYVYSCSRLAFVYSDGNNWIFDAWVESSEWRFTQEGVTIMEADDEIGVNSSGNKNDFTLTPADNNYTQIIDVDLSTIGGSVDSDGIRAIVFSPAGRVKGSTRFVTVGDATYDGTTWLVKNPEPAGSSINNESCKNQVTLEFNRFTGGASYWQPTEY